MANINQKSVGEVSRFLFKLPVSIVFMPTQSNGWILRPKKKAPQFLAHQTTHAEIGSKDVFLFFPSRAVVALQLAQI